MQNAKSNPLENPIIINCTGSAEISIEELTPFQGELKTLSEENMKKLEGSILVEGFISPFFVWKNKGKNYVIDGHSTLKTLKHLKDLGWDLPKFPYVEITAKTRKEAKIKLLKITSQFGEFDPDELSKWVESLGGIMDDIRLVDVEITRMITEDLDIDDFLSSEDKNETEQVEKVCPHCGMVL